MSGRLVAGVVVLVVALGVAACGQSSGPSSNESAGSAQSASSTSGMAMTSSGMPTSSILGAASSAVTSAGGSTASSAAASAAASTAISSASMNSNAAAPTGTVRSSDESKGSGNSSETAPTSTGATSTKKVKPQPGAMITIKDFNYRVSGPVHPGDKVTVKNLDNVAHTVTADTGNAFDVKVPPGTTKTFTAPPKAGTYAFHCTYHATMHGKLVVK